MYVKYLKKKFRVIGNGGDSRWTLIPLVVYLPNQTRTSVTVEHKRSNKQHLENCDVDGVGENYNKRENGSNRVRIYIFIILHTSSNFSKKFDMADKTSTIPYGVGLVQWPT